MLCPTKHGFRPSSLPWDSWVSVWIDFSRKKALTVFPWSSSVVALAPSPEVTSCLR